VPGGSTRVLIYGADDAGVSLSQELRRHAGYERLVAGFIDDDPLKRRTRIQGLPVIGGIDDLPAALRDAAIEEVIVASADATDAEIDRIRAICADAGVAVSRFDINVSMAGVDARLGRLT
jgi:FlaA1/EpsC-like NDP-sugar epimerase